MKKNIKASKKVTAAKKRQIESLKYRSFRLSKRLKHKAGPLPGTMVLLRKSVKHVWAYKKLFFGIAAVHICLSMLLVRGFGFGSDVPELKSVLDEVFTGGGGQLIGGVAVFSFLLGAAGSTSSDVGSVYQSLLLILISLAIIWALRQTHAKKKVSVKDAFYKGIHPFIPFLLVLIVIILQLIPFAIGTTLFSVVSSTGLAVGGIEQLFWILVFGLFGLLSLYMLSSSLFATYIVTLPDVLPLQALRSARGLVLNRRWAVMRRVLLLPIAIVLLGAVIMIPLIIFATPLAEWVFFALSILSLAFIHSYLYSLYRELL
jgi:hypothetical protein